MKSSLPPAPTVTIKYGKKSRRIRLYPFQEAIAQSIAYQLHKGHPILYAHIQCGYGKHHIMQRVADLMDTRRWCKRNKKQ